VSFIFTPGNEIWDKMGDNSAPLFLGPRYPMDMVLFKFSPVNPRCHGNEFWDKIGYNSAPVKDNCALFAPTPLFSGPGYLMLSFKFLSWRPLLLWQRILEQNLLSLGLCKRYLQDFCVYRGVFGNRPSNAANRIFPHATLVAMATKFGT